MPHIPLGTKGEFRTKVKHDNAIDFLGRNDARVLGTPWLIAYLEMTSRDAVKSCLSDGEDTVGTQVNVRHLAATPMGCAVRFEAEVIRVEGRRVEFRVAAFDEVECIAEGTHERAVIDVSRFAARLNAKRTQKA